MTTDSINSINSTELSLNPGCTFARVIVVQAKGNRVNNCSGICKFHDRRLQ